LKFYFISKIFSIKYIGNTFLPIVFTDVTKLSVYDVVPFKHEFFIRIARSFPLLKKLSVMNFESQSQISDKSNSDVNQLNTVVEYLDLISLRLERVYIDYVEQFLNETKTHLPRLIKLTVDYDQLTIVTENFTRDAIRLNCVKVKELVVKKALAHSKDFYVYFPLL
jgi:trehalose/maltose hydrolase-like predicted phosphorylase